MPYLYPISKGQYVREYKLVLAVITNVTFTIGEAIKNSDEMHQLQFIVTYISSSYIYGHFYRWHQSVHLSKMHIMIYDIDFDKYPYSPFYSIRRKGRYKSSPSII